MFNEKPFVKNVLSGVITLTCLIVVICFVPYVVALDVNSAYFPDDVKGYVVAVTSEDRSLIEYFFNTSFQDVFIVDSNLIQTGDALAHSGICIDKGQTYALQLIELQPSTNISYRYKIIFNNSLSADLDNMEELEEESVFLLGEDFTIVDVKIDQDGLHLKLWGGPVHDVLV